MKEDCFGYRVKYEMPLCAVLNEMLCRSGECPFYKSLDKFRQDLIDTNGTSDLESTVKKYSEYKLGGTEE